MSTGDQALLRCEGAFFVGVLFTGFNLADLLSARRDSRTAAADGSAESPFKRLRSAL